MITQIDIRDVRRIVAAHLRREVANEEIALGKILTDLATWEKGETPPALKPTLDAAPFDVGPRRRALRACSATDARGHSAIVGCLK